MSLPNPQRQAAEEVFGKSKPWEAGKIPTKGNLVFRSPTGEPLYFLGVSFGSPSSKHHPNLNIAVFSFLPPKRKKSTRSLAICQFGVISTGPHRKGWYRVEGLKIAGVDTRGEMIDLRGNRRTDKYRPTW